MTNAIFNNAYGVLGLLPNATQNEIKRRVKELEKRLQIDEVPSFEYDFGIFNTLRNEKGIKAANDELSSIQRQILHSFFRVYVNSENHAQTLKTLTKSGEGIREFYDSKDSWDFISKKNFAIALSLYMCEYTTEDFCLKLWDELLNSQNHLLTFKKIFLNDDENVSETHFDGLRERLINELSRVFSEVADKTGEESVLAKFIKKFGTQNLDENIGKESFDELKKALGILEKLNISADGVYDDEEKATIKKCLKMFENGFEKLKNLGLYDSSKCLQIRDLAVKKIRTQSIDLHKLSQSEESLKLTEFAMKISASQGSKSLLEQDFEALKQQIQDNEIMPHITELIKLIDNLQKMTNSYDIYIHLDKIKNKFKYLQRELTRQDLSNEFQRALRLGTDENILNTLAIRIRNTAIYLCNEKSQYATAKTLLNLALEFANVSATKESIRKDLADIAEVAPNIFKSLEKSISYGFWFLILLVAAKACS